MENIILTIWTGGGFIAAAVAFIWSEPYDPWWPEETTRLPQMVFAFALWPFCLLGLIGLFAWGAYRQLKE